MKKIAFAFLAAMAVLSFAGCKKKGGAADALAKLEGFKKDMCACTTKECAEKVSKAMDDWSKSQGEAGEKAAKEMSEADKKKGMALAEEMGKCMMKAMGAGAPPAPAGGETPPAGGATPPAGGETPPAGGSAAAPAGGETPPAGGSAAAPAAGGSAEGAK
jgi:hypothetical protein